MHDPQQGRSVERLLDRVAAARDAATRRPDRHALAVHGVAADRRVDLAAALGGHAEDERQVLLPHLAGGELRRQGAVRGVVLGDQDQARGPAVETVDDPGPQHAADAGEVADAVQQGVHQGSAGGAGTGMDDEPGRLVDHEQVRVLVDDVERDGLRLWLRRRCRRDVDGDELPLAESRRRAGGRAVEEHVPLRDQPLQACPRERGQRAREPGVQALAERVVIGGQPVIGRGRSPQAEVATDFACAARRRSSGNRTATASSRAIDTSCDVESVRPNQSPRSASPRQNSSTKRTLE